MDNKNVIIDQLMRRLDSLLQRYQQLLQKYQKLEAENLELEERITRLEKNSSTSFKPPSSDIIHPPTNVVKTKKRKRGGQQGHPKHTREPFPADQIDETVVHKLSEEEVKHRELVELPQTALALQHISLLNKLYRITEHRVQLYKTCDGRIISTILPPEVVRQGCFRPI